MDADILKRMKEVEKGVLGLDESIRGEAFRMMRGYILTGEIAPSAPVEVPAVEVPAMDAASDTSVSVSVSKSESVFLKRHESEKVTRTSSQSRRGGTRSTATLCSNPTRISERSRIATG